MKKSYCRQNARTAHAGFSVVELMMTVVVAAVLAAIAIPNMRDFVRSGRLTGAANDLLHSFHKARSEAIKRQVNVVVCASSNASTCDYGDFSAWIVFEDTDGNWQRNGAEPLLETHDSIHSTVTAFTDADGIEAYAATGFALQTGPGRVPTRNVTFCDARGNQALNASDSTARAVLIDATGRPRVSRLQADITAAGNCT